MKIDVVILSYAKDEYLKSITQYGLDTLIASESGSNLMFNPIVIESEQSLKPYQYRNATKTIYRDPKEEFNYNKCMNQGFQEGDGEFVAFCNNDLDYKDHWMSLMVHYMNKYGLNSASPWCSRTHRNRIAIEDVILGNKVRAIIAGWCIVVRRNWFEKLGGFDERVTFYCSDNIYSEQLNKIGETHGLVTRSVVNHLQSPTIKSMDSDTIEKLTKGETRKFNKIFNQNILNWGQA